MLVLFAAAFALTMEGFLLLCWLVLDLHFYVNERRAAILSSFSSVALFRV